jgi:hypothetical protein
MRLVAGLSFKPCRVGISEPGRSLPLINLQFVADCKAQNPNFGQRNALPSQAVEPPVQISPPQPAAIRKRRRRHRPMTVALAKSEFGEHLRSLLDQPSAALFNEARPPAPAPGKRNAPHGLAVPRRAGGIPGESRGNRLEHQRNDDEVLCPRETCNSPDNPELLENIATMRSETHRVARVTAADI